MGKLEGWVRNEFGQIEMDMRDGYELGRNVCESATGWEGHVGGSVR